MEQTKLLLITVFSHSNVEKAGSRRKLLLLQAYTALHLCGLKIKPSTPHLRTIIVCGTSHYFTAILSIIKTWEKKRPKLSLRFNIFALKSLTAPNHGFILPRFDLH